VAGDVGPGVVQGPALQERLELRACLAAQAGFFLPFALGLDAFVLFLLRADRVRTREIDVLARAGRPAALALAAARTRSAAPGLVRAAPGPGIARLRRLRRAGRLRRRLRHRLRRGLRRGLETQAQQLIAQRIAHGNAVDQ